MVVTPLCASWLIILVWYTFKYIWCLRWWLILNLYSRFITGYWLFHCHLSFHIEVGMGLIFKIGEHSDFPPVPKGFPTCGNWIPPMDDDEEEISSNSDSHNDTFNSNAIEIDLFLSNTIHSKHVTKTVSSTTPNGKIYQDNVILPHRLVNGSLSQLDASVPGFTSLGHPRQHLAVSTFALMAGSLCVLILLNRR